MHRVPAKNFLRLFCVLVLAFSFSSTCARAALDYEDYPVVKLRSLDKITARTMTFEAKVGSTVRFGEIFIKVQSCRKPPPVEKSEAAAFLQIWQSEDRGDDQQQSSKWIFSGWMFASSPALSAMDHPVYDVWVLDCLGRDPEPIPPPEASAVPAPATDGAAPDAVPPAVEPDKQKIDETTAPAEKPVDAAVDDPGTVDDSVPEESVPSSNMPADAAPSETQPYVPSTDTPDQYQDDTPQDDTPAPEVVKPETLEPEPEKAPESKQEFQGIY